MTNRRRSGKGRTSNAKKSESPDKQTKKLNRRGRRSKKSETPEPPEKAGLECSGEEIDDSHNKGVDGDEESDSCKESSQFTHDTSKTNDDQKSQTKEEESGGSDGSWKVKSENGGGGGIPKLKLCLTRPPEMPSPTSEQNPSPRRRRRSGRGNATPTKEEQIEENTTEEPLKRVTRNQKIRETLNETSVEKEVEEPEVKEVEEEEPVVKPVEEEEPVVKPVEEEPVVKPVEEGPVVKPVEEGPVVKPVEEEEQLVQVVKEAKEEEKKSVIKEDEEKSVIKENVKEEFNSMNIAAYNAEEDETRLAVESICGTQQNDDNQMSMIENVQEEVIMKSNIECVEKISEPSVEQNFEASVDEIPIPSVKTTVEEVPKIRETIKESTESQPAETPSQNTMENRETEMQVSAQIDLTPTKSVQETVLEIMERRRSSSRDSSEERAKEAALRSINKNKRKEGSEEGEVIESPGGDRKLHTDSQDKSKKSSARSTVSERGVKENLEDSAPLKSGARKRRWGSSTSRANKKPSVSISTDFLKEIIPEAKPLLMSEVQLSPNDEDEEGQLKDSEESLPIATKKIEREKIVQSDESEKDYEEEAVESGVEEPINTEVTKPTVQIKEKEFTAFTRKVSVMSSNEKLQKSPSPPRNKPSNILYIVNLVRPFTIPQLRELLARTGSIMDDGFWIDKIKSKCYVKYETEEQAKTTRHALHGVRWPVSNPKQLSVDFGTEAAMKAAMEGNEIAAKRPIPSLFDKQIDLKTTEKTREREKERERERDRDRERDKDRDRDRDRERDRDKSGDRRERNERDKKDRVKHKEEDKREEGEDEKDKKSRPAVEPLVRDRTVRRVTMPIREWDVGKNEDGFSPPPDGLEFSRHRDDRYERRVEYDKDKRDEYDDRRRRERDRGRRSMSGEPPRKSKKKTEEEAPAKLLDDLFRKTKATPCIYWLPLTPEQIAVKEEMRRKHMAEHEKKVAELKKMQREQSKRSFDKRRRRTRSRSRSRSAKK